jgi:hypothetical protein
MKAGDDDAVSIFIEQRHGEALVGAGVLEGVEAHQPDALDRLPTLRLERRRPGADRADRRIDFTDAAQMSLQDRLERSTTLAPRQTGKACRERADPPPKDRDDDR